MTGAHGIVRVGSSSLNDGDKGLPDPSDNDGKALDARGE
jgi:hypothetical protein